jgi:hypothetical protein
MGYSGLSYDSVAVTEKCEPYESTAEVACTISIFVTDLLKPSVCFMYHLFYCLETLHFSHTTPLCVTYIFQNKERTAIFSYDIKYLGVYDGDWVFTVR